MRKYSDAVFRIACRFTGDAHDAEDICQEVFLQVWRSASGFRGGALFSTWLYRIVVNRCLNHRRRKIRDRLRLAPLPDATPDDRTPAAADEIADRETVKSLEAALGELPERQRLALILSRFEGRSYREIAAILETTVPSVESLIRRARAGLREKLSRGC